MAKKLFFITTYSISIVRSLADCHFGLFDTQQLHCLCLNKPLSYTHMLVCILTPCSKSIILISTVSFILLSVLPL